MQNLNNEQIKILRNLKAIYETNPNTAYFGNIIVDQLDSNYYIELQSANCTLRIKESSLAIKGKIDAEAKAKVYLDKLLQIISFFELLEKESYIVLKDELPIAILGASFSVNEKPMGLDIIDKYASEKIFRIARHIIVPTEKLIKLVKYLFKTEKDNKDAKTEGLDHKMLWYQKRSYQIGLIGLFVPIIFGIVPFFKDNGIDHNAKPSRNEIERQSIDSSISPTIESTKSQKSHQPAKKTSTEREKLDSIVNSILNK